MLPHATSDASPVVHLISRSLPNSLGGYGCTQSTETTLNLKKMEPFAQKHVFMNAEPCASIFPCVRQSRKEKQSVARTKTCRQIRALRRSANSNTCVAMEIFLSSEFMFCYVNHLKLQVSKHDRAQLIKDGMAEPCACWHTQRNLSLSGTNKAVVTCWD